MGRLSQMNNAAAICREMDRLLSSHFLDISQSININKN